MLRKPKAAPFSLVPTQRSNHSWESVSGAGSWCWQVFFQEGVLLTPMGILRRFLLLKQVTVLLSPHGAALPLLVGCVSSAKALVLLRSPRISTKPSSVFLGQLALAGLLPFPYLALRLATTTLGLAMTEATPGEVDQGIPGAWVGWWSGTVPCMLAERLLDTHLLASLLLLGLLGLEGALVSRWPLQTRRLRTAQYAQLSCCLVWLLVLLELLVVAVDVGWMAGVKPDIYQTDSVSYAPLALPNSSIYLRRTLWLGNVWLHYFVIYCRPPRRASCFH
ncbi:hypothetical protein NHX12_011380 [Muraenolepis orangiensis]|uniref:G-protein coupled receptors family 1 profile domain-containing protein n=1 Tax=Muraenolepis orangiensis TaxID=630683 RepID=A0A9Q0I6M3_9TELE|nr:hypothetical protein NHX12_011380 [Muraenolepis orangiensis]